MGLVYKLIFTGLGFINYSFDASFKSPFDSLSPGDVFDKSSRALSKWLSSLLRELLNGTVATLLVRDGRREFMLLD